MRTVRFMDAPSQMLTHPHRVIARAAAVIGLLSIALIHLLDLEGKLKETPYLGVGYIALIIASVVAAGALMHRDDRGSWFATAAISAATLIGYAVNRTIGMPAAMDDIGNWLEPLGLASLFVEAITCAVAVYALADRQSAASVQSKRRMHAA